MTASYPASSRVFRSPNTALQGGKTSRLFTAFSSGARREGKLCSALLGVTSLVVEEHRLGDSQQGSGGFEQQQPGCCSCPGGPCDQRAHKRGTTVAYHSFLYPLLSPSSLI